MSEATAACPQHELSPLEQLCIEHALPCVDLAAFSPQPEAIRLVHHSIARKLQVLPLSRVGPVLTIVLSEPNLSTVDLLRFSTGLCVEIVLTVPEALDEAITRFYNVAPADTLFEEVRYTEEHSAKFIEKSNLLISSALTSHTVKHVRRRADGYHAWEIEVPTESASELIAQALRQLRQR
jgi:hypothetical protein